ncbi:ankyrin, partial [Polyplosphaeria fusca]
LLSSIRHHNDSLFSMLLIEGQHFDEVDSDGRGVLWHIVESGFSRMMPLFKILELGLEPDVSDKFGETPLHCAVRSQSLDDATTFVRAGADVTRKLSDGTTVLHLATQNLDLDMIRCLLDGGASVNAVDDCQQSAIHALFLQAPHEEPSSVFAVARLLLSRGASTSSTDSSGWTPIHAIALWNDELISKPDFSLLISGMDLAVRGKDGTTVLHSAA